MESQTKSPPAYETQPQNPEVMSAMPPAYQPSPMNIAQGPTVAVGRPVVMVPHAVVTVVPMGPKPQHMTCRSCNQQIITQVKPKNGTKTHLFALALCLLGCWCCVCIPYCTDSCRNIDHYCPNCDAYIGGYEEKMFR